MPCAGPVGNLKVVKPSSCPPEFHSLAGEARQHKNHCGRIQLMCSRDEGKHIMQEVTLDKFLEEMGFKLGLEVCRTLKVTAIINLKCLNGKGGSWVWVCGFLSLPHGPLYFFVRNSGFPGIFCPVFTSPFPPSQVCMFPTVPPLPTPSVIWRSLSLLGREYSSLGPMAQFDFNLILLPGL